MDKRGAPAGAGADGRAGECEAAGWRRIVFLDSHVHTPLSGLSSGKRRVRAGVGQKAPRSLPVCPAGGEAGTRRAVRGSSGGRGAGARVKKWPLGLPARCQRHKMEDAAARAG